jgi:hypothetical protein
MPQGANQVDPEFGFLDAYPGLRAAFEDVLALADERPGSAVRTARVFAEELLTQVAILRGSPRQADATGRKEEFAPLIKRLHQEGHLSYSEMKRIIAVKRPGDHASHNVAIDQYTGRKCAIDVKELARTFRGALSSPVSNGSPLGGSVPTGDMAQTIGRPQTSDNMQSRPGYASGPKGPQKRPIPPIAGEQNILQSPIRPAKRSIGRFVWYGVAAIVVLWLIGQISNAIRGSSAINFTSMATASGVENNHPIGVSSLFNAAPAQVTLYAEYANGRVSDDRVQMAVWNANGGRVAACNDITIRYERGNAWCNVSLPEGSFTFSLGANGKVLNTTQFRVVDGDRLQSMASAVLISDNVRNGQPSGDVRTYSAGSTVGMYLPYHNAQSDTVSVQLVKDGSEVNSCKDYVLPTASENYWCDWNSLGVGQYSIALSIDGKNVGKYDFEVVERATADASAESVPSSPTDAPTPGPAPDADQAMTRRAVQQYPVPALRYEARPYRSPLYRQFANPPRQYGRYYGPGWYPRPRRQR